MTSSELVDAPEAQVGLSSTIARKRPSANEIRTIETREDERPDEDAQERLADQRVAQDALKFSRPMFVRQPGSSSSPPSGDERALAVVAEDLAVLDPRERVVDRGRSGASARARARPRCPRPGSRPARVGTVKRRELLVEREQLRALDDLVALGRVDRADLGDLGQRPLVERLQAVARADERLPVDLVDEEEHEVAVLVARRRHHVRGRRPRAGASELRLIPSIASLLTRMWPVDQFVKPTLTL